MDNSGSEELDGRPGETNPDAPVYENDPYPKMIIVCIIISLFLLFLIALLLMLDFSVRNATQEIRPQNPAFFEEHLQNTPE